MTLNTSLFFADQLLQEREQIAKQLKEIQITIERLSRKPGANISVEQQQMLALHQRLRTIDKRIQDRNSQSLPGSNRGFHSTTLSSSKNS